VQPATVLAGHRRRFRLFWTWKSRHRTGRLRVGPSSRIISRDVNTNRSGAHLHPRSDPEVGNLSHQPVRRDIGGGGNSPKDLRSSRHAVNHSLSKLLGKSIDSPTGAVSIGPRSGAQMEKYWRRRERQVKTRKLSNEFADLGGGGGSRTRERRFRQCLDDARLLKKYPCRTVVYDPSESPPQSTGIHSARPGSWRHCGGGGHPCPPPVNLRPRYYNHHGD